MMAKSGQQEVVFEGWLTKSPPTKRIWRARWRRRWFSLSHSGEIPNQFILTYYADRNCRKLKGSINLDDCEQVDLGLKLDEKKLKFDHVFDIKTPMRTYYLAADSENEMKSWVNCICKVCGLKSTSDEEDLHISDNVPVDGDVAYFEENEQHVPLNSLDTPPISPVSTSPYIPISECVTGKTPILDSQSFKEIIAQNRLANEFFNHQNTQQHTNQTYGISQRNNYLNNYVNDIQDPRFYDCPRVLTLNSHHHHPHHPSHHQQQDRHQQQQQHHLKETQDEKHQIDLREANKNHHDHSPLQSPTDSESVFTDDDNADFSVTVTRKFTKSNQSVEAPPRPPKPPQIGTATSYINLNMQSSSTANTLSKNDYDSSNEKITGGSNKSNDAQQKVTITDDMYDFPRSHQVESDTLRSVSRRHCYNNAAPAKVEGQIFRYDISPKPCSSNNQVFRYDSEDLQDEPASPLSQSSSTTAYSNLPSPLLTSETQLMPPPMVNRDLKPKRKLSDSLSLASNPEPSSPRAAPCVDRKLKPPTPLQEAHMRKAFNDDRKTCAKPGLSPTCSQVPSIYENSRKARTSPTFCNNNNHFVDESAGESSSGRRTMRAAPSPTPPGITQSLETLLLSSDHEQLYHHLPKKMQYLDLDLDCGPTASFSNLSSNTMPSGVSNNSNTVYKIVDFKKTAAFNITRNNLEKERQEPVSFSKK